MAKQTPKKSPSSKTAAKKATVKKSTPAKKVTAKKAAVKPPAKKVPSKKTAAAKKTAAKKAPTAKKTAVPTPTETKTKKKTAAKAGPIKAKARKAVTTGTSTAAVKKTNSTTTKKRPSAARKAPAETVGRPTGLKKKARSKPVRRTAFTLEEVQEIAKTNALEAEKNAPATEAAKAAAARKAAELEEVEQERRVHAAASLADILGYNPASSNPRQDEEKKIPKKHIRYYRLLVDLGDHVKSEISLHTEDTLKRSSKEDSGDLSSYSQHAADAGTDTFDRDFALSLVSSEQEALYEIEEAIKRIKSGTYGVCELTGKPIAKDRLLAVPFARYSVESQAQVEKTTRRTVQRGGAFADADAADAAPFIRDDSGD